jgi:hypothetical protein
LSNGCDGENCHSQQGNRSPGSRQRRWLQIETSS